jgi:hypothetical protein
MLDRLAAGWAAGDAEAVAAEFAAEVRYAEPMLYRFGRRSDLVPSVPRSRAGRTDAGFTERP